MSTHPSPLRFSIARDPRREPTDRVLDIEYRATPDAAPQKFGHCWEVRGWGPEYDGTWQFNRDRVAIENEYWDCDNAKDAQYPTCAALLLHLEATFQEGVPHCQPT